MVIMKNQADVFAFDLFNGFDYFEDVKVMI